MVDPGYSELNDVDECVTALCHIQGCLDDVLPRLKPEHATTYALAAAHLQMVVDLLTGATEEPSAS